MQYIRALLPALNVLRRRTGLPHRILLDEAHYYLHETECRPTLDFDRNGYTVVTYCASRLPKALLAATDVMIVTCESDPAEVDALGRWCASAAHGRERRLGDARSSEAGEAVALPITEEAGGKLRLFTMAPRMTPHVRHREKYVDVPVSEPGRSCSGEWQPSAHRARTLRQFVLELESTSPGVFDLYVRRGDFSRWIGDVFGDRSLAVELDKLEAQHRLTPRAETVPDRCGDSGALRRRR